MKKALVLCGGGSLGAYEVGVWKYFREKGERFDIVCGTSIGAINGAFVTTGEFEKCQALWQNVAADKIMINGLDFQSDIFKNFNGTTQGKLLAFAKTYVQNKGADISPFINLVKQSIDPHAIKESSIQLGAVTVSYPLMKEEDILIQKLPESQILDYLHASSACWPIFPVYQIGEKNMWMVDIEIIFQSISLSDSGQTISLPYCSTPCQKCHSIPS